MPQHEALETTGFDLHQGWDIRFAVSCGTGGSVNWIDGEQTMRSVLILLACVLFPGPPAFSAIKYQRFPSCLAGILTVKTCECHARMARRYHFCHAGGACDAETGECHK